MPRLPNIDATVAAAVAATRTASDVQERVAATLRAPTPTTAPPTPRTESVSTVKKILDKVIPLSENHYNKGTEYMEDEQYEIAIHEFNKAIQLDPDYYAAYFNRGYSYDGLGEYQTAISDHTKAIEFDSDYAGAYNNRSISYRALGQSTLAAADKTMACSLDSRYC